MTVEGTKALAWMLAHQGQFGYSNSDPQRDHPLTSGLSDCSGVIRAAYQATSGINPGKLSFHQASNGRLIQRGYSWASRDPSLWQPGDVIAMDFQGGFDRIEHVEMYAGNVGGRLSMIGHGGTPYMGPNLRPLSDGWYTRHIVAWKVVRFGHDAPKPKPKPKHTDSEDEYDMTCAGIYAGFPDRVKYAIVDTVSGLFTEWSAGGGAGKMPGSYNNPLAGTFKTGSFAEVTPSHYDAIKASAKAVREAR